MTIRWLAGTAWLLVPSLLGAAPVFQFTGQGRSVEVSAQVGGETPDSDSDVASADDFGPFDAIVSVDIGDTVDTSASAYAEQHSLLGSDFISLTGDVWASANSNQGSSVLASASSFLTVSFDVTSETSYRLEGIVPPFAGVRFTGPGVNLDFRGFDLPGPEGVLGSGRLPTGSYTLSFDASGEAGEGFSGSAGEHSLHLQAGVIPLPPPLAAGALLLAIAAFKSRKLTTRGN